IGKFFKAGGKAADAAERAARHGDEAVDLAKTIERLETDGSIQNVFQVPAGSKNNWSRAINGSLEPNAAYKLDNGHVYVTDTAGRVKGVEGELSLSKMDRNAHQQCVVGKCGNAG